MAAGDLSLTLGVPSGDREGVATPLTKVQRIRLPKGTRVFLITSDSAFYLEEDTATPQTKAHDGNSEADKRHKFAAGTYAIRPVKSGRGQQVLEADRYVYFVGTIASQPFWIWAVAETGQ